MLGVILRSFFLQTIILGTRNLVENANEARGCEATLPFFACAMVMLVVILHCQTGSC